MTHEHEEVTLPCDGCTVCCENNDQVFIHPEHGDKVGDYIVTPFYGRFVLAHAPNGDCIYLDRDVGCTIYDRRPSVCRTLDCRKVLLRVPKEILATVSEYMLLAAARMNERYPLPPLPFKPKKAKKRRVRVK